MATPLLFSDDKLEGLLSRLRAIEHVEFIRIGSRVPIFLPQRVTPALCAMLQKYHPLWMSVHVNHPRELTLEVKAALERLANSGVPLGNQSVLLRGVNDNVETMRSLVHKLLRCRVRPYYLYQLDLIKGSSHLQVPGGERNRNYRGVCAVTLPGTPFPNMSSTHRAAGARCPSIRTTSSITTRRKWSSAITRAKCSNTPNLPL